MKAQGAGQTGIAKALGVGRFSVYRVLQSADRTPRPDTLPKSIVSQNTAAAKKAAASRKSHQRSPVEQRGPGAPGFYKARRHLMAAGSLP